MPPRGRLGMTLWGKRHALRMPGWEVAKLAGMTHARFWQLENEAGPPARAHELIALGRVLQEPTLEQMGQEMQAETAEA